MSDKDLRYFVVVNSHGVTVMASAHKLAAESWVVGSNRLIEMAPLAELERVRGEVAAATASKNDAYRERNTIVAALARMFPSGIRRTDIPGWDAEWHGCVFIDTPQGQMSWHYHDSDAALFGDLPPYTKEWDGHSTPEKYARLARIGNSVAAAVARERREMVEYIGTIRDCFFDGPIKRMCVALIDYIESRPTPGAAKEDASRVL